MARKETNLTLGISEPQKVDEYMENLKHPLFDLSQYLRTFILSVDKNIGEGIYWNVPTFYFTGKMKPFEPKEYRRFIVNFNFYKQDILRIIFLKGADVTDKTGLLEGDYKDGRRIVSFKSIDDLKSKEKELKSIISQVIKLMDNLEKGENNKPLT
ncbi:MAG: DUF1801 domain-containing protein [Sediminibacterium sp.]|nr:DUF1801 domain-containing protein [Sediminibacterium sp.]